MQQPDSALLQRVREQVAGYVVPSPNATMYFMEDNERHGYAAVSVPREHKNKARVVVMARVEANKVIIETDITDKPLHQALQQAGIKQQQIVLAYMGETEPMA